jgi:L-lactate dehydrogenase (cytochrome)
VTTLLDKKKRQILQNFSPKISRVISRIKEKALRRDSRTNEAPFLPPLSFFPLFFSVLFAHIMSTFLAKLTKPFVDIIFQPNVHRCFNVNDLQSAARVRCHKYVYDYIAGGADDESALRNNRDSFRRKYDAYPFVLNGVGPENVCTKTSLFDGTVRMDVPFMPAPIAGNAMFHVDGERAVARTCRKFGTTYALSTLATTSCEEIERCLRSSSGEEEKASTTPTHKMFQMYVWNEGKLVDDALRKAKESGFETLVLTVDLTWFGNRERDKHNGFSIPPKLSDPRFIYECLKKPCWTVDAVIGWKNRTFEYAALRDDTKLMEKQRDDMAGFVRDVFNPTFDWEDAKALREKWGKKFILKGVHRSDDAVKAFEYLNADAVWISNHGGRQLDGAVAPFDALPSIRKAVGEDRELIIDSGIRRGSDIALALALGANAVAIGKPVAFGLAAGGEKGVERTFTILKEELERTMGLVGARTIAELRSKGKEIFVEREHLRN